MKRLFLALMLTLSLSAPAAAADPDWDTCQGDPFCERVPDSVPYDPGLDG